jgi:H-type lectin domain
VVHLGLTGFDLDQRDGNRLSLRATEIGTASFVAEIATWRETRAYSVEFCWLALGA